MDGHTSAWTWAGVAAVTLGMPVPGAPTAVLVLRRVEASPLGTVRRVRAGTRPKVMAFGLVALFLVVLFLVVLFLSYVSLDSGRGGFSTAPALIVWALALTGAGAVWLVGAAARLRPAAGRPHGEPGATGCPRRRRPTAGRGSGAPA
ncbi:hypothetical protein AB0K85_15285 [Streptomyces cellulosae]